MNPDDDILHRRATGRREHTERAFPPLRLIDDGEVLWDTLDAIQTHVPRYFWSAPAASSYAHHNPYCCGERGLWIHTLMVSTVFERLVDSWTGQNLITPYEADLGRAVCLLHDLRKHGESYEAGDSAARDHDLRMAARIRDESDLDDRVADAVASHMGPWYEGPEPETPLEQLVHQADMLASTKNATVGVWHKPVDVSKLYPALPEAEL